jgi:hypothetical protein
MKEFNAFVMTQQIPAIILDKEIKYLSLVR